MRRWGGVRGRGGDGEVIWVGENFKCITSREIYLFAKIS